MALPGPIFRNVKPDESDASLGAWRDRHPLSVEQLARFLQGYDAPPHGYAAGEPHEWVVEAGYPDEALARVLAQLLTDPISAARTARRPEELLYNAFALAADLRKPGLLSAPLIALMRTGVTGTWRAVPLAAVLRDALVANQSDDTLRSVWTAALERAIEAPLPCGPIDGLAGLVLMPLGSGESSDSRVSVLAGYIGALTRRIEERDSPGARRYRLLLRVMFDRYAAIHPTNEWLVAAVEASWPDWVLETQPAVRHEIANGPYKSVEARRETVRVVLRREANARLQRNDAGAARSLTAGAERSARAAGLIGTA
jgi:hypothetical protein